MNDGGKKIVQPIWDEFSTRTYFLSEKILAEKKILPSWNKNLKNYFWYQRT